MSFQKLKNYKNYGKPLDIDVPLNPYKKINNTNQETSKAPEVKGILEGESKHLKSKVVELEREIKFLREDIASLYFMLKNLAGKLEINEEEDIRNVYYTLFKQDKEVLRNILNENKNRIPGKD